MRFLELRLDNVIYRMNFAASRTNAKQLISHGHIQVNGKKVTVSSYILKVGDEISFNEKSIKNENIKLILEGITGLVETPEWIIVDTEKNLGKINNLPNREDVSLDVEEHLIVELYSK